MRRPVDQPYRLAQGERGSVTLLVALVLPVLVVAAALAIDLAYARVVRSELQNAADAAALGGARALLDGSTPEVRWDEANLRAQDSVALNRADGQTLSTGEVQSGYWNLRGDPPWLQATALSPGPWDVPAVSVTVRKQAGTNGGAVGLRFARLWRLAGMELQASATAALSSPGLMLPGAVFPLAMSQCLYNDYWNSSVYPPRPRIDPATGSPHVFRIGSGYHYGSCASGDWSSLLEDFNDVSGLRQLMIRGNPLTLQLGQMIWIQPGTKSALYQSTQGCSAAGDRSCEYVIVPTVTQTENHALSAITGFACLRLLGASNSQKYVLVQMSTQCPPAQSGGIGPNYGVVNPPGLVR